MPQNKFFENSVQNYKFSNCICGLVYDSIKNIQNLSKSKLIEVLLYYYA